MNTLLNIHKGAHMFHWLINQLHDGCQPLTRLQLGLIVRTAGEHYDVSLLLGSCLWYLEQVLSESAKQGLHLQPVDADLAFEIEKLMVGSGLSNLASLSSDSHRIDLSGVDSSLSKAIETSYVIASRIDAWNLTQCYNLLPLLNGNVILKEFPKLKGSQIFDLMTYQIAWQLGNSDSTSSELLEHLKTKYAEFRP